MGFLKEAEQIAGGDSEYTAPQLIRWTHSDVEKTEYIDVKIIKAAA